jgi:hypothetical protein
MSMPMGRGHGSVVAGGMSMSSAGHGGGVSILPTWLAVIWTLVFIAIFVVHARHLRETRGQRRLWHSGHVLMALGMTFMFAPASIDHLDIPHSFWQLAFAGGALVILAWMLTEAAERRAINALWIVMAIDLAAMVYMFSPNGYRAPLSWLLVAYFAAQTLLWATDRMRTIDHRALPGAISITPDGALGTATATAAAPLICYRDLRISMSAMTLGMAYMFAAMQLLM